MMATCVSSQVATFLISETLLYSTPNLNWVSRSILLYQSSEQVEFNRLSGKPVLSKMHGFLAIDITRRS
jgi:hypothetical protein